jgi:hypothetical protein
MKNRFDQLQPPEKIIFTFKYFKPKSKTGFENTLSGII